MAIPYRTAKFNILEIAILCSTAKFNYRQYFRLYGITTYDQHKVVTDLVSYGVEKGSLLQPFTNTKLYIHQICVENLQIKKNAMFNHKN